MNMRIEKGILISFILAAVLASSSFRPQQFHFSREISTRGAENAGEINVPNGAVLSIYMPLVQKPRPVTTFGSQLGALNNTTLTYAYQANTGWARSVVLDWSRIEPVLAQPRQYYWDVVDEAGLREAYDRRVSMVATVIMTPAWAQKYPGVACGPVAQANLSQFAAFMQAAVARYSRGPYAIKYWELGNEVDIGWNGVSPDSTFGCWGDPSDPYYGGGYYAEMLKIAYPAIKAADPEAQILVGGLLLNCDPTHPPAAGVDCAPGNFLEGILKSGGGPYFDEVSFHGYAYYWDKIFDQDQANWKHRGGVVLGKIDFLRTVMAAYGVNKPVMLTEASLVCPEWNPNCASPGQDFFEAQADYVASVYIRAWAAGVVATIWYAMDNNYWRFCSLIGQNGPQPAYYALVFMTQELQEAKLGAQITSFSGLDGYSFAARGKTIWVLWSNDTQAHPMTLPSNVSQIKDKYGNPISIPGDAVLDVKSPVYIEIGS
jgi:hypothetical protein